MRFTIRDLFWLLALAGTGLAWFLTAQRSALLEARLQYAERRIGELNSRNETLTARSKTDLAALEAVVTAVNRADLSEEQRKRFGDLFAEELQRLGVKIVVQY